MGFGARTALEQVYIYVAYVTVNSQAIQAEFHSRDPQVDRATF